uniref:Uncharacterized protein n=1 Tax=Coniophora olivacea TaxID=85977 RepID=A0A896YYG6_9AGAM
MFNPFIFISRTIITIFVRRVNLPDIFSSLAGQIFFISRDLIRSQGMIPTLTGLLTLRRLILSRGSLQDLTNSTRVNPVVSRAIYNIVQGKWGACTDNAPVINRYFYGFIFSLILSRFPAIFFKISKFSIGLLFSSLGIFYTDILPLVLPSVTFLKDWAKSYLQFVENHSSIKLLSQTEILNKDNATYLSMLGLILLGLVGITISLVSADYFFPDAIGKVPAVNTYVDFIKSITSGISSWVQGFFNKETLQQPTLDEINRTERISRLPAPESISRVSSSGSDLTVRGIELITPPSTPEPVLPNPWDIV